MPLTSPASPLSGSLNGQGGRSDRRRHRGGQTSKNIEDLGMSCGETESTKSGPMESCMSYTPVRVKRNMSVSR